MAQRQWIGPAVAGMKRRGTVGAARRAGMDTMAYARKMVGKGSNASSLLKKRARFALNATAWQRGGRGGAARRRLGRT